MLALLVPIQSKVQNSNGCLERYGKSHYTNPNKKKYFSTTFTTCLKTYYNFIDEIAAPHSAHNKNSIPLQWRSNQKPV